MKRFSILALVALVCAGAVAQTHTFPALDTSNVWTGRNDFSGASSTAPVKSGLFASAPATCVAYKDLYLATDKTVGQQLYQCNATGNGWVVLGGGGSSGVAFDVKNVYGGVPDDATDNATVFATITTAVNAYTGSGTAVIWCSQSAGDKAYKTTGPLGPFTVNVLIDGGCTIDNAGTGDVITASPTGLGTLWTKAWIPATVENITFIGGASATAGSAAIRFPTYGGSVRAINNNCHNYGPGSSTLVWCVKVEGWHPESTLEDNWCTFDDAVAGRSCIYDIDDIHTGASNTSHIIANHLLAVNPAGCGNIGFYLGGFQQDVTDNSVFGFGQGILLSNNLISNVTGGKIIDNSLDTDGCAGPGGVRTIITFGDSNANSMSDWEIAFNHQNRTNASDTLFDKGSVNFQGVSKLHVFGNHINLAAKLTNITQGGSGCGSDCWGLGNSGYTSLWGFAPQGQIVGQAVSSSPSCVFTSGGGTGPSCAAGQTSCDDNFCKFKMTTGTGSPAASGVVTITFVGTYSSARASCTFTPDASVGTWSGRAAMVNGANSATTIQMLWDNNGSTLSTSTDYYFVAQCRGTP